MRIKYLNTDLDLKSADDLHSLVAALETRGLCGLHVTLGEDQHWDSILECEEQHAEPEASIQTMLDAVEALSEGERQSWDRCLLREFNVGYDCGAEPWAFNQGLSNSTLARMAAVGSTFRLTLYPPVRQVTASTSGE